MRFETDRLKIQSPVPRSMCTTYSSYQDCASFTILNNYFYPGYFLFKLTKYIFSGVENLSLRNDNNTFIILQPQDSLDLHRNDASFRLVKMGICNYTSWGEWGACSETCHMDDCGNPVKTRERYCQAGSLSGVVYDF
nr:uncharacterized protein LOC124810255 [Hydra vulgaris]